MNGVGDMVLSTDGRWIIRLPEKCANGHLLKGRCIVAAQPCSCGDRHLSWYCDVCEHVTYGSPLGPDCEVLHGLARVR